MTACLSRFDEDRVSIDEWTKAFTELYKIPDSTRRPEEFWNSVMAHLSSVGEAIRKTDYKEIVVESSYAFCWMCGLIAKCNNLEHDPVFRIDHCLSELVALKFPDRCGLCEEVHCRCDAVVMDQKKDKAGKYKDLLKIWKSYKSVWPKRSFKEWLDVFHSIFRARIHIQTLESICFHMLEEAGEEAKAVRQLVQFRGLAQGGAHGVDSTFLLKLTKIDSLVCAYNECTDRAKDALDGESFKEVMKKDPKRILTSNDSVIIRTRLVYAKMDFVIEMADTFSWMCSVLLKLRNIIEDLKLEQNENEKFHIEYELRHSFAQLEKGGTVKRDRKIPKLKCYVCGEEQCKCLFFHENSPIPEPKRVKD
jgi:hypothetical protein